MWGQTRQVKVLKSFLGFPFRQNRVRVFSLDWSFTESCGYFWSCSNRLTPDREAGRRSSWWHRLYTTGRGYFAYYRFKHHFLSHTNFNFILLQGSGELRQWSIQREGAWPAGGGQIQLLGPQLQRGLVSSVECWNCQAPHPALSSNSSWKSQSRDETFRPLFKVNQQDWWDSKNHSDLLLL